MSKFVNFVNFVNFVIFIIFIFLMNILVFFAVTASASVLAGETRAIGVVGETKEAKETKATKATRVTRGEKNDKYEKRAVGWHWYNEIYPENERDEEIDKMSMKEREKSKQRREKANKKNKKENKRENKKEKTEGKEKSAMFQMSILRRAVREAKARAVLYPTVSNIRSYLILQNFVMDKAALFTRMWKKTLLNYPELDYSILHPTQNSAQHILYAEIGKKEDDAIKIFGKKYGLLFFYRGNSYLDQALAPTIISFSKKYNISLLPISVDGKGLPVFDNPFDASFAKSSVFDNGQAEKLGIKHFPALILVDPKNQTVLPLNYGFISGSELRRRFLQIATNFREGV